MPLAEDPKCHLTLPRQPSRGRVRRIAVLAEDGRQVNLLASSALPATRLIEIMRGRWRQENAFKHGNERWGINHLDARCKVARYDDGQRRDLALLDLELALQEQRERDALPPTVPRQARVGDTELAGTLVRHDGRRKLLLDTIRIACANAESDLAHMLAQHLRKPREAKRVLATIFRSPRRVRVGATTISVDRAPAATRAEAAAITGFLRDVSGFDLTLPSDPLRAGHSASDPKSHDAPAGSLEPPQRGAHDAACTGGAKY